MISPLLVELGFSWERNHRPPDLVYESKVITAWVLVVVVRRQSRQLTGKLGYFDVAGPDYPSICRRLPVPRHQEGSKPHASFQPEFRENLNRSQRNHFSKQINILNISLDLYSGSKGYQSNPPPHLTILVAILSMRFDMNILLRWSGCKLLQKSQFSKWKTGLRKV